MNACGLCVLAFALFAAGPVRATDHLAPSDMVSVAAGSFTMGRDDGPPDERPAHQVNLGAFEIDRLPVTNIQFAEFLMEADLKREEREFRLPAACAHG